MTRWFLPKNPDLIGLLARQGDVTVRGIDAFLAWSKGAGQAAAVFTAEQEANDASRQVLLAVKHVFIAPVSPEDVYELSERLDAVLDTAKDLVREADLLQRGPDPAMAEMAEPVAQGVRDLVRALPDLATAPDRATDCADEAAGRKAAIEDAYRRAMSAARAADDPRELAERRELYRRCVGLGTAIERVAHRIWYAVVKEA